MATSSSGTQTDLDQYENLNCTTRQQFVAQFGDEGELHQRDRVPGCAVNEADTVMWVPEGFDLPIMMSCGDYQDRTVGAWREGIEESDEDDEIAVITLSSEECRHVVKAELVNQLADAVDMEVEEIMGRARLHQSNEAAPVLLEMEEGLVLIAPRVTDADEIRYDD